MDLFEKILAVRGLTGASKHTFLNPDYDHRHDPFLLPDMEKAVDRLVVARENQERITIYGDYDIDGLTATTVMLDAFKQFGFKYVDAFIPNRFIEGYGMTIDAVEKIAASGTSLIVTVDCGSLSEAEIVRAKELNVDVIVTDHHNVAPTQPPAVAVINPKRLLADYPDEYENFILKKESKKNGKVYPFLDLPGVGVVFKLVQAMQTKMDGIPSGQEKWLLDLVALGTVCDVVNLTNENRLHVYWGLKVLAKTRRPGLKALMAVAEITPDKITARSLGFGLGPRMNAAGRLETAQYSLDLLTTEDMQKAYALAQQLDVMNTTRRIEQDKIVAEAERQVDQFDADHVLVLSGKNWSHGIIGIVAAKIMERYQKPTFILEEMDDEAKGSARSYGDFSVADAIRSADDLIIKGGGHKFAAGVTLPVKNIHLFRERVNEHYESLKLASQNSLLLPKADVVARLDEVTEELVTAMGQLEPFGNANPQPVLKTSDVVVVGQRLMGAKQQHVKLKVVDDQNYSMQFLAFNAPNSFFVDTGTRISIWYQPTLNEWNGRRSVEGILLHIEVTT